jgi:hypothetical protein
MTMTNKTIFNAVRARLIEKNTNINDWARHNGFSPGVAQEILRRHCGRSTRPTGPRAKEIISAVGAETGIQICG